MNKQIHRASIINIVANFIILIIISFFGIFFSSLSMISKAIESFADILTAFVIHFTIKINNKKADEDHQFGHTRAENIAGYTIGVTMVLLSLTIMYESLVSLLLQKQTFVYSEVLLYVTIFALVIKIFLYFYMSYVLRSLKSPALQANKEDHLNDIYMFIGILFAYIGSLYGFYFLDLIVGLVIGLLILHSGISLCRENIDFLMGKVAEDSTIKIIKEKAYQIKEVNNINEIKTQYLGTMIQVEIHIALDKDMKLQKAHTISHKVQDAIESIEDVEHCFVHLEEYKS